MQLLLLLENDTALANTITDYLHNYNFKVTIARNSDEALDHLYESSFDLYLFEADIPTTNGFELLKMLRKEDDKTPTIFITTLQDIEDISKGFESGADDYIKKPFELKELLLRIQNILKRSYVQQRSNLIEIDKDLHFDIESETLIEQGESVSLPQKELKALKYFLKHPKETLTFENLYKVMWEYDETPSPEALRTHLKNLRKHLSHNIIENIRGIGYRYQPMAS